MLFRSAIGAVIDFVVIDKIVGKSAPKIHNSATAIATENFLHFLSLHSYSSSYLWLPDSIDIFRLLDVLEMRI